MGSQEKYLFLGPADVVPERPFTAPQQIGQDVINLDYMACELRHRLSQPESLAGLAPVAFNLQETGYPFAPDGVRNCGGRQYRIAFIKMESLRREQELVVVGFCGHKRPAADRVLVDAVDEELVAEFPQHPYFLSYSSLELNNGDWCNLVLFSHWDGLEHWNNSARHWQAVREIAPKYYETIRLHNAILPGGLLSGQKLKMVRTKYYDFGSVAPWLAVREYHEVTGAAG
jgi:hypothetical protein